MLRVALSLRSNYYSPLIKRNRVPYVNFFTHSVAPTVTPVTDEVRPYTLEKNNSLVAKLPKQEKSRCQVLKALSTLKVNSGGRNFAGRVTARHRGGGNRVRVRFIDRKLARKDIYFTVLRLEYCPRISGLIALVQYDDGVLSYVLASETTRPGDRNVSSDQAPISPGNSLPLSRIPVGTMIYSIESRPGAGGKFARSAGAYGLVIEKTAEYAVVRMRSSELRKFSTEAWACIGQVSNRNHMNFKRIHAGNNRWVGLRPIVAGTRMTPDEHPHGGGNMRRHTKGPPVSKWGILMRTFRTRNLRPVPHIVQRRIRKVIRRKFLMDPECRGWD